MARYPSGLDARIVRLREENRDRIIKVVIRSIDEERVRAKRYSFEEGMSNEQKYLQVLEWWDDHRFHLRFAVRSPELLNEMLGHSLDPDTMAVLEQAREAGIPFFVNPYYLSLLHVRVPYFAIGADMAIRDYVIYRRPLVKEFGHIVAWEKEDLVEPGKPNAAGWLLPSHHNVHRRYPEVAILIPDTTGRACAGLCASCQRMFDFQRGNLNFDLERLRPRETWTDKLDRLMNYFEQDSQLRDILITGGDALMSADAALEQILDAVCRMATRKREANAARLAGENFAEIVRVRLGTRLPVFLPQRITAELIQILSDFKRRGTEIGIRQFVIQTHFESPMEVTPEARQAIQRLASAGWLVTNQHVLTASASRRGHPARLRQVLGEVGVLPYYTFAVKGYMENQYAFATNARAVQEQIQEKVIGTVPEHREAEITACIDEPEQLAARIAALRREEDLPFIATDRTVLNLPGVGKSLTFRVIGITRYGRRILEFEHDATRQHSPVIDQMGHVIVIESKSISEYLQQLEQMGENLGDYDGIWGFSIGQTEPRFPMYEYPEPTEATSEELTHFAMPEPEPPRSTPSHHR